MHTMTSGKTRFTYNGDYSGYVRIQSLETEALVSIPIEDLHAFLAHQIRRKRIAELEQMEDTELLEIKKPPTSKG